MGSPAKPANAVAMEVAQDQATFPNDEIAAYFVASINPLQPTLNFRIEVSASGKGRLHESHRSHSILMHRKHGVAVNDRAISSIIQPPPLPHVPLQAAQVIRNDPPDFQNIAIAGPRSVKRQSHDRINLIGEAWNAP